MCPTTVHDVYSVMMKVLGIDHTKLTWRNNGIDRRITDGPCHKKAAGCREPPQSMAVEVNSIHHIGRGRLDQQSVEQVDVVHFPRRNVHKTDAVAPEIQERALLDRRFRQNAPSNIREPCLNRTPDTADCSTKNQRHRKLGEPRDLSPAAYNLERIKPMCIAGSGAAKVSSRARIRPMLVERSPTPEPTFPGTPHRRYS
jgi:hypothetical protein